MRTVSNLGERELIARITGRLASPAWVVVGPGDDAAVIEPARRALDVLTTDAQVEGIHFDRRFCPPHAIGHKALAVTLSDLAAMGATPRAALLSLVLPDGLPVSDLDGLLDGLLALAARHPVSLVGGNIARSPGPLMLDVTAVGAVERRRVLTRAGARPGDEVYVTGSIGAGAAGLQMFLTSAGDVASDSDASDGASRRRVEELTSCQAWYLRPEPRMRAGMMLGRNRAATACMDLSDGLADGIRQIAQASDVGMAIDAQVVPVDACARRWHTEHGRDPHEAALSGGDDYELLFTVRPSHLGRLRGVRSLLGDLPITRIGVVTKERRLVVRTASGTRELPGGFEHFRGQS